MNKKRTFIKFLENYNSDVYYMDKLIVASFIKFNKLFVERNKLVKKCITEVNYLDIETFIERYNDYKENFDFTDLIELFEVVIPKEDKVTNGAVYTPKIMKKHIVDKCINSIDKDIKKI